MGSGTWKCELVIYLRKFPGKVLEGLPGFFLLLIVKCRRKKKKIEGRNIKQKEPGLNRIRNSEPLLMARDVKEIASEHCQE